MKLAQVTIVSVSAVLAVCAVMTGLQSSNQPSPVYFTFFVCVTLVVVISVRYLAIGRGGVGEDQRRLIDEYRRLADLAVTAQEHTDLKLGDMSVRIDHLMEQMASLQKILNDVE